LMVVVHHDYEQILFWIRFSHAAAVVIPWFVFALAFTFSAGTSVFSKQVKVILHTTLLLSVAMAGLSFTPFIIADMEMPLHNKHLAYGSLFSLYVLFFVGIMTYGIIKLFRMMRSARGLLRLQLRYFVGGITISTLLGSIANLFFPLLDVTILDLRNFGPVFSIIMVASIGYAIVKYRLMDVHFALRKGLAFVVALAVLSGIVILSFYFIEGLGIPLADFPLYVVVGAVALLVASLFQSLKGVVQTLIDKYVYRGAYDYYATLLKSSRAMISFLDLRDLLQFVIGTIVNNMYLDGGVFLLKKGNRFVAVAAAGNKNFAIETQDKQILTDDDSFVKYLVNHGEVLLQTDLRVITHRKEGESLITEMQRLQAEAAVPMMMEGEMVGFFCLGPKLSGEPYSREDVKLLTALAFQVTVCLRNAQLYQEVLTIKRYLENILENMGNGLIAVDAQGRITTFNGAAEKLTGQSASAVIGQKIEEVLSRELCTLLGQVMERGRGSSDVEVEMPADGFTRFVCCSTAVMELPETGERGAILVLSDVTRIKELEQEKSWIQRLAFLGEVAAGLAHEIKNPLVSIKTFAELLPEKYDNHEFRYSFSRIVSQEIERINRLLAELLNFSKNSPLSCETVDMTSLMDEILLLLSPQIDAHKIRVFRHYDPVVPAVWADRNQLKQAVFNICLNSIQAMPEGGELRVSVLSVPAADDESAGAVAPGGKVKILIEDTGVGISAHQKDKVFDPFFTTKADGVGIGLSISHKIIGDHGGTIQIRSGDGEGAAFEICLPPGIEKWPGSRDLFRGREVEFDWGRDPL